MVVSPSSGISPQPALGVDLQQISSESLMPWVWELGHHINAGHLCMFTPLVSFNITQIISQAGLDLGLVYFLFPFH